MSSVAVPFIPSILAAVCSQLAELFCGSLGRISDQHTPPPSQQAFRNSLEAMFCSVGKGFEHRPVPRSFCVVHLRLPVTEPGPVFCFFNVTGPLRDIRAPPAGHLLSKCSALACLKHIQPGKHWQIRGSYWWFHEDTEKATTHAPNLLRSPLPEGLQLRPVGLFPCTSKPKH